MMPIALRNGITIDEFERRTFKEVTMIIEANFENEERKLKSETMLSYQMVDLIAASVARLMDKDAKFPNIYDIYPTMFGEELRIEQEEARAKAEAAQLTAQWAQFVNIHNSNLPQ